jgi:hypothetical protein
MRQWMPAAARAAVGRVGQRLPLGFRGRNYVVGVALDAPGSVAQFNLYFDRQARRRLLCGRRGAAIEPEAFKVALCRDGRSILQQATAVDFQTYLVDDILVKVDRASMLASLEVRAPWLDPRLIAFAFRLPDNLRATSRVASYSSSSARSCPIRICSTSVARLRTAAASDCGTSFVAACTPMADDRSARVLQIPAVTRSPH